MVKTATRNFPISFLSSSVVNERGDHYALVNKSSSGSIKMMALLSVDRETRYFICTAGSQSAGEPHEIVQWRQVESIAERVALTIHKPYVVGTYYSDCSAIDQHNRCRQDDLAIE